MARYLRIKESELWPSDRMKPEVEYTFIHAQMEGDDEPMLYVYEASIPAKEIWKEIESKGDS